MSTQVNPLVDATACLMLYFRRPGIIRKLRKDQFEAGDAEKDLIGAQKKIVDSVEYAHVGAFENHVKSYLKSKALPSRLYRDATYLIPLSSMMAVDTFLEAARVEWQEKVEAYVAVYDERRAETKKRLGELGDDGDYMSLLELKKAFGFEFEYVTLSTPTTLKKISAAMFEREEQRLRERLASAQDEIVSVMRARFLEFVNAMKSMLDGTDTAGKTQRFSGRRIEKLQAFIEDFTAEKNVCGDAELQSLMKDASKLLSGVNPKELRDDKAWREATSLSFAGISETLTTMTKIRQRRQIDVEEQA